MRHTFASFMKAALALAFVAAPLAAHGQTVRYHVVPLPEAPSPSFCVPTAINDVGDVVGYCNAGEANPFAVLWRGGVVEDLGAWEDSTFTHAWAINAAGRIVGDGGDADAIAKALIRGATTWIQVDGSGGSLQTAVGITDDEVVFGNFTTQGGSIGTIDWDPVYWTFDADHNRYDRIDLPKAPGTLTGAFIFAANRSGAAVGEVASNEVGNQAGFWNNDASHTLAVLPPLPGFPSATASGISDDARVVGAAFNGSQSRAVLWLNNAAHTAVDLGTLPGDQTSAAHGVNVAGQVVGVSGGSGLVDRGFLYQEGALQELTTLVIPADSAWKITQAIGINNAGEIIAMGMIGGSPVPIKLIPTAVPAVTSLTITADRTAPQETGTTVTFTATAAGGSEPIEFKWLLHDGSVTTTAREWSTATTFEWTPATANASYRMTVWARSAGNTAEAPERSAEMTFPIVDRLSVVTLGANRTAPQVPGTTVTFTATATGGVSPVEFKWLVNDGVTSTAAQDWSTADTFAWTPATANAAYRVIVWARSSGNEVDAAGQSAEMPFAIVNPLSALALAADKAAPQVPGTTVTFTAMATGGIAPLEFKWQVNDGATSSVARDWSTTATFAWTPTTASASYQVIVWARSAGNSADVAEQAATINFPIASIPAAAVILTADKKAPERPGTTVTFTAKAMGGLGPIGFKWLVYNGSAWTVAQEWSAAATFAWTPTAGNRSYQVRVWVRSFGNPSDVPEQSATMSFPIHGPSITPR